MKTNLYFRLALLILAIFWLNFIAFSQNIVGFKSNYVFVKSGSIVQDKNFYLLTLFESAIQFEAVMNIIYIRNNLLLLLFKPINT